jgi:hypothetical protein
MKEIRLSLTPLVSKVKIKGIVKENVNDEDGEVRVEEENDNRKLKKRLIDKNMYFLKSNPTKFIRSYTSKYKMSKN